MLLHGILEAYESASEVDARQTGACVVQPTRPGKAEKAVAFLHLVADVQIFGLTCRKLEARLANR